MREEIPVLPKSSIHAAAYIRCSTEMQEDSPDQQRKEIVAFANLHGYEIIEWFDDYGKSGTSFDQRPEFQVVRRIFHRRSRGLAYLSIAAELNRDCIPCPKRGRWRNKGQKWSTVTIKTILDNPTYYGARV